MDIREYMEKVIALFRDGKPNDAQWGELAHAVLNASEEDRINTICIDKEIDPCSLEEDQP